MTGTFRTFAIALAMVIGAAGAAQAQDNCQMYGKLALQQQRDNIQKKCGFTGPEWSGDLKGHMLWCTSVGPDQWKDQLKKRAEMLAKCG